MSNVYTAVYGKATGTSAITTLIGTRLYPGQAPENASFPFAVYDLITTPRVYSHDGPSYLAYPRVQISFYDTTLTGAKAVADAFRTAFDCQSGTWGGAVVQHCKIEDEREQPLQPADTGDDVIYGISQDYTVWIEE